MMNSLLDALPEDNENNRCMNWLPCGCFSKDDLYIIIIIIMIMMRMMMVDDDDDSDDDDRWWWWW